MKLGIRAAFSWQSRRVSFTEHQAIKECHHPLVLCAPGTQREVVSLHYGPIDRGRKAVIQASLHADEAPGLLVAQHLRAQLAELEQSGQLQAEVVLLPFANPIGLAQSLLHRHIGRFDLASGQNFNRHYPQLVELVARQVSLDEVQDPERCVPQVRAALRQVVAELTIASELQSLRQILLGLAIDADLVLDLHSDSEALLHLYTATSLWPVVEPLARLLGSPVNLLAEESGDDPFDEACSMLWPRLAAKLSAQSGQTIELPAACVAVTVELRGAGDVCHELAASDARGLIDYLRWSGFVVGPVPTLPGLLHPPSPLAGCLPVVAPHAGVLVPVTDLGALVRAGDRLADLVDPLSGCVTTLASPVDGLLFARLRERYVQAGARVAKVAGTEALRAGKLLSD